jgi:NAD(P)-dependent dehydrogenase (short-subunit alcohol dehydrogenase family)
VIEWLTGFDESALSGHLAGGTTFEDFFADARLNPHASLVTGVVCGVRVEDMLGRHRHHSGALEGERKTQLLAGIPVGRNGNVNDVADLITFLCRKETGYITGATYDVNGGSHIH